VHATAWYPTEGLDWHGGTLRLQGREPRTWSELCDRIGISIVDLDGRPRVGPFMIGFGFGDADRSELSRLEGQHGRVVVRVHVAFDGSPTVQIAASSGSPLLDRTAAAMVSRSHWLPALREGQAVDDEVEFPVTFDDGNATGLVMEGLPAGR
jgi:TonB family protein